jgi:hypothetical protein
MWNKRNKIRKKRKKFKKKDMNGRDKKIKNKN